MLPLKINSEDLRRSEEKKLQWMLESENIAIIKDVIMEFVNVKVSDTKSFYKYMEIGVGICTLYKSEYEKLQLKKQVAINIKNNLGNEEIVNQICGNDKDLKEKLINLRNFSLEGYDNYISKINIDENKYIKYLVCNMLFETEQNETKIETFIEKVKRLSNIEDNDALNDAVRQVRTFLKELFDNKNFRENFIKDFKHFYFSEIKINDNSELTIVEGNNIPDNQNDIDKKIALLTYEAEMWYYPDSRAFINDNNRMQDNYLEGYIKKILTETATNKLNTIFQITYGMIHKSKQHLKRDQLEQQATLSLYQIQQKLNNENEEDTDRDLLKCKINLFFSKETYKLFYTTDICEKMQELAKSNNEQINKFIKSGYFSKEQIELLCNRMYPRIEDIYANYSEYQQIYGFSEVNKSSGIREIFNRDKFSKFMCDVFERYHSQDITAFDNTQQQELENDLSNKFGSNCVFSYGMNDFNNFLESKYIVELTNKNKEFNRSYIQKWFYEFATNVYNNRIRLKNENFKQLRKEIDTAINGMPTKEQMQSQQIATLEIQNIKLQQQREALQKELQEQIAALDRKNRELQQQKEVAEKKLQEMENANNQLKTENQKLIDQNNDLLKQKSQSNQQSQNLTTEMAENVGDVAQDLDLPNDDIRAGNRENQQMENAVDDESVTGSSDFNENQPEQTGESNKRIEDFEE